MGAVLAPTRWAAERLRTAPERGVEGPGGPTGPPGPAQPLPHPASSQPHSGPLLYSGSLRLWVLSFLLISCFLDLTMAELLSVSLLKKAGGWLVLPGDLEPILL